MRVHASYLRRIAPDKSIEPLWPPAVSRGSDDDRRSLDLSETSCPELARIARSSWRRGRGPRIFVAPNLTARQRHRARQEHRNGHPLSVANLAAGKISWKSKTRQRSTANDRDGSNSEVGGRNREVRFTPNNGHRQAGPACPFGAKGLNRSRGRAPRRPTHATR
jgi:hypothetical protein